MCSSLRDDHKCSKRITDNTDATDQFFHGFLFDVFGLFALRRIGFIRIIPSLEAIPRRTGAMKSVTNPRLKEIREKIKSVASVLSVIDFERVRKSP